MRFMLGLAAAFLAGNALLLHRNDNDGQARADEKGPAWTNIFPGENFKGWRRVAIAPDTRPNARNPWKVNGKILECDGVGIKEMLLHDTERQDGVFHVEWRFRKVPEGGKDDYNSGVYIRTSQDGKIWHQAQVAHQDKAPRYADLFGDTLVGGKPKKFLMEGSGAKLVKPPGEWNTYEITCKGPKIAVAVNGSPATAWNDCEVQKGYIGLQAEYFFIEFKALKFRPLE